MRIQLDVIRELMSRPIAVQPLTHQPVKRCGREAARSNEKLVLYAIAKFGHLRTSEIGRFVWPNASHAQQMAQRTCNRLLKAGHLLNRRNALGGISYVLTRPGAGWLSLNGIPARHTLELSSVGGATFIHRTLSTRYLIEQASDTVSVAGEYEIAGRALPFSIDKLVQRLQKMPDGLVWRNEKDGRVAVDWVEVENASKPRSEIAKLLGVAQYAGVLFDPGANAYLKRLVVVFDGQLNHGDRLRKTAKDIWCNAPQDKKYLYMGAVSLVAASITAPLVWQGAQESKLLVAKNGQR
jgi:hypothetical protein